MTDKEVLKPCPCRGAEAKEDPGLIFYMIKCTKCGLNVFDDLKREETVKRRWNRRVTDEPKRTKKSKD